MDSNELLTLGLQLAAPWMVSSSSLRLDEQPSKLELTVSAGRGATYPCPICGRQCKAHDFKKHSWQHLNFFQHKCIITANVPRVRCPEHGVHQVDVPWARRGSGFTLLFEEYVLVFCREMPVSKIAEITGVSDKRIWRILEYYIKKSMDKLDLSNVCGIGVDETASKRGHKYVTVFVDMDRETRPVIFATEGKGKDTFTQFKSFLQKHGGNPHDITEIVCDMSPAFRSASESVFPYANVTVDWFHVVQIFSRAVDAVRRIESRHVKMPKSARWALLKGKETEKTDAQKEALKELKKCGYETSRAYLIKEKLRWTKDAETKEEGKWRIGQFVNYARRLIAGSKYLSPIEDALDTFLRHRDEIVQRWHSMLTNARLESLNSLFQAVRARARGYRNVSTFITMIYLIAAPISELLLQE